MLRIYSSIYLIDFLVCFVLPFAEYIALLANKTNNL